MNLVVGVAANALNDDLLQLSPHTGIVLLINKRTIKVDSKATGGSHAGTALQERKRLHMPCV